MYRLVTSTTNNVNVMYVVMFCGTHNVAIAIKVVPNVRFIILFNVGLLSIISWYLSITVTNMLTCSSKLSKDILVVTRAIDIGMVTELKRNMTSKNDAERNTVEIALSSRKNGSIGYMYNRETN